MSVATMQRTPVRLKPPFRADPAGSFLRPRQRLLVVETARELRGDA
jgi:hypothetical protein